MLKASPKYKDKALNISGYGEPQCPNMKLEEKKMK